VNSLIGRRRSPLRCSKGVSERQRESTPSLHEDIALIVAARVGHFTGGH
jgi:hypothetical protein